MAEAGNVASGLGLPGEVSQWPLRRYGRFMLLDNGESPGPSSAAAAAPSPTWKVRPEGQKGPPAARSPGKVFESNEESGCLVLTIVVSGHFFISQGQTLLEGFSLIGSKNWLKIVRRMDCLLFGTTIKDKSRMFRVQFSGESQEEALEHCCGCVQILAQYVTVQEPDRITQELQQSPGPREAGESQGKDPLQQGSSLILEQHVCMAAGTGPLEERTSVTHLAQAMFSVLNYLGSHNQPVWSFGTPAVYPGAREADPSL
ncbi:meiotic recombination protein REC114 isoform X3 [Rattus rattus]|uniref:meiotic recombination protein REC114 isoform X3 n=1 Tax=Rattus rattus TaxID=10117 RepID=UPI0013F3076A|nr:meiotic recombination protein REC114 isoform X3 [Rattus rattus]